LCYIVKDGQVLLVMKKRGFGQGKWNAPGGKPQEGETLLSAAARETLEEVGLAVKEEDLNKIGEFVFYFVGEPVFEIHAFKTETFAGEPLETEEMQPSWFNVDELPWEFMWVSDSHWLNKALEGQKIKANVYFNEDGTVVEKYESQIADF
jgi:8-oxo-dGTP pyrophosphatase MutT (NUDIX family)